jgi:hypothetical protein
MGPRFKMGRSSITALCVYCLAAFPVKELTKDHVVAKSWYPAHTPPVEKWKVPSCRECNNKKGAHEEKILMRVAWCMDPTDKNVTHIIEKARRAIDPTKATSARDAKHRLNRKLALGRDVKQFKQLNARSVLPAFVGNAAKGSTTGILVPGDSLERLAEMWVQGIYFCHFGKPIASGSILNTYFVHDDVAKEAFKEIIQHAIHLKKGPGVEVLLWHVEEDDQEMTSFAFNIWDNFRAYGTVEAELNEGITI